MKKIFLFCFIFFLNSTNLYANIFTDVNIWDIKIQYITYKINSAEYELKVALSENATSLKTLAQDNNAITAINGIFFCPADYFECKGKNYTINERFQNGQDLSFYPDSGDRWIFWWDKDWVPLLHQTNKINPDIRDTIFEGMGNFPILYANGVSMLEYYHDVGLYDTKMQNKLSRHFICSNQEKTEIFFWKTAAISLDDLAPILYSLWCWDGINLDAGNSSSFIYNGRSLETGARGILDGFVITRKDFDVQVLDEKLDLILSILQKKNKHISNKKLIPFLDSYLRLLPKIRTEIYERYSLDILDTQWNIIWYSVEITSLSDLKRVYMINGLEQRLKYWKNSKL